MTPARLTPEEELGRVALALRAEREEEEERLSSILKNLPLKQRKADGVTRGPLTVSRLAFVYGGQPELSLERQPGKYPGDQFTQGTPVFVSRENGDRLKGVVSYANATVMRVALYGDDFPDDVRSGQWFVDLRFDDKTFFEMEKALNRAINLEGGGEKRLRDILLGYAASEGTDEELAASLSIDARLNPSQHEAVRRCVATRDVALVHGPPGTGKTTTIAEAIRIYASREQRVLVTAPTNAAADVLTLRLASLGVKVVRLGHASRVDERAFIHSFDAQLEAMAEMKLVKELRRRAEEAFADADKFKRSFGADERKARAAARHDARELQREARDTERFAADKLLEGAQAIVCTLVGSSDLRIAKISFDAVFIDEAGQALEPAAWIAALRAPKVVLAGDPFQLPPTVKSQKAANDGLSVTLLEKAIERSGSACLLNEQYRMNSVIMGFSNQWFYNNQLTAHGSVAEHALSDDEPVLEFIDTAGCGFDEQHPEEGSTQSLCNIDEAALLAKRLNELLNQYAQSIQSVGVISPYRAQVECLTEAIESDPRVVVQTIDGFQGQERDVMLISLTRSNADGVIGFLSDYRRMNVAMTRARRKLVVIGDSATLGGDAFYAAFMEYCEQHGVYRSGYEWM